MKSVMELSRECAASNHVYFSGEIRVGDIAAPLGVCTPIMHFPMVFHGKVGGAIEEYGALRGVESLPGSPSSTTIWRRPLCARWGGRAGEEGGGGDRPRVPPPGFGRGEVEARLLMRVGACADELRLMRGG